MSTPTIPEVPSFSELWDVSEPRSHVYMRKAAEIEDERRDGRLRRLRDRRAGLAAATRAVGEVGDADHLLIRDPFVRLDDPRDLDEDTDEELDEELDAAAERGRQRQAAHQDVATRPPSTQLVHRQSRGLAFYLLALWVAQASLSPGRRFNNKRPLISRYRGWSTLIGDYDQTPSLNSSRNARDRLARILNELQSLHLVEMPPRGQSRRYDRFKLLAESQDDRRYTVPRRTDSCVRLPAAFIRNGWHLVLAPPELATYLMFVDLSERYADKHRTEGVGIAPSERWRWYGVTPEVYEVHNELTAFGLLERQPDSVPGRRRGRVPTGTLPSDLVTYAFKVKPDALDRDAFKTVTASLDDPLQARYMQDPKQP